MSSGNCSIETLFSLSHLKLHISEALSLQARFCVVLYNEVNLYDN